jgi:hypothetical protein
MRAGGESPPALLFFCRANPFSPPFGAPRRALIRVPKARAIVMIVIVIAKNHP